MVTIKQCLDNNKIYTDDSSNHSDPNQWIPIQSQHVKGVCQICFYELRQIRTLFAFNLSEEAVFLPQPKQPCAALKLHCGRSDFLELVAKHPLS